MPEEEHGGARPAADSSPTVAETATGETSSPPSPSQVGPAGRPFGPFVLVEELGRGGMGVVWKAWDLRLRRTVALKQVHSDASTATDRIERFVREARLAARLRHPNIQTIHEVGVHEGQHYYTTDYLVARPMEAILRDGVPPRTGVGWVRTIAEALHYAHGQGVIHRDVKPANILIDGEGRAWLTDFGVAKEAALEALPGGHGTTLTATGSLVGSPQYMSPEQARGRTHELGPASDQFSLGVVLYEVLTGRAPFEGESLRELLNAVVEKDPIPPRALAPRVHVDVQTICLKAMEKDPARRYPSLGALAADLARYLEGEPIDARPAPLLARAWRRCLKHPVKLTAATLVLATAAWAVWREARAAADHERIVEETRRSEAEGRAQRRARAQPLFESAQRILEVSEVMAREGALARRRDGLGEAVSLLDRALAEDPEFAEAWFARARVERHLGRREEALSDLGRTIRLRETWSAPYVERIGILVDRFYDLRDPTLMLLEPGAPIQWTFRDVSSDPVAREVQSVIEADVARVLSLGVRPEEALYLKGVILSTLDKPEEAIECLSEAIRIFPYYADAFMKRSYPLLMLSRSEEALADANRALELWPASFQALQYRGTIRMARADAGAAEDFLRAAELDPARFEPHESLSALYLGAGDFEAAVREATVSLRLREDHRPLCNRATALIGLGRLAEADRDLARAIELCPQDSSSWAQRAQVFIQQGDLASARRNLDEALRLGGTSPVLSAIDASLRWQEGDLEGAERRVDELLAADPAWLELREMRGEIRIDRGKLVPGLQDLQAYLAGAPGAADATAIRTKALRIWALAASDLAHRAVDALTR